MDEQMLDARRRDEDMREALLRITRGMQRIVDTPAKGGMHYAEAFGFGLAAVEALATGVDPDLVATRFEAS